MNGVALVHEKNKNVKTMAEMNDGEIGIIISGQYTGEIVQCFPSESCNVLHYVNIGKNSGHSWHGEEIMHKVRILLPGEKIEIL